MDIDDTPPSPDEIELTVFGPGYGEAVILHLGNNNWMLVDSCIYPATKQPVSLYYLNRIGVSPSSVCTIVASHWHDDHVQGLSVLVQEFSDAEFFISGVFNKKEMLSFLSAYGGLDISLKGTNELYRSITAKATPNFAHQRTILYEQMIGTRQIRVSAFSPTSKAQAQSKLHYAKYLPEIGGDRTAFAPDLSPNIEAVVIHIDLVDDGILLGSDLEDHPVGWSAVLSDSWCTGRQLATVYKAAHHGSITGDNREIWEKLLKKTPFVSLTPFINGSTSIPREADRIRIRGLAEAAFISSGTSRRPRMGHEIEKRLSDICTELSLVNPGFGGVRFRKKFGATKWNVALFGDADLL